MENKEESFFPNFDPTNDLAQARKQRRMKRGLGAKPLLESEIKETIFLVDDLMLRNFCTYHLKQRSTIIACIAFILLNGFKYIGWKKEMPQ